MTPPTTDAERAPTSPAEESRTSRFRLIARVCVALFGVLVLVGLLAYGLAAKSPSTDIDEGLLRSESVTAPGFDLPVLDSGSSGAKLAGTVDGAASDGHVSLTELRGTPVVLNFWASWCPPCRTEAPVLEQGWRSAQQRGVLFVGLNTQDLTADARDFIAEFGNSYLNVRDQSDGVPRKWGVTGLPETFFIARSGKIVAHVIGAVSEEQLNEGIAAAESGRPLGRLEGGERRTVR